jgi:hypothetical protein
MEDLFNFPRICPDSPKLLNLLEVGVDYAMDKNYLWHSRLPETSKGNMLRNTHAIFYGAEFKDHCFGVAMWTTPVANNRMSKDKVWLELRRLAISSDAPKFTATWMISKMVKEIHKKFPEITTLVSYQDTEVHKGTIYKAANWTCDSLSKFQEWTNEKRKRNTLQSKADKVRWIYEL